MIGYRVLLEKYLQEVSNSFEVLITCRNGEARSIRCEDIMTESKTQINKKINITLNSDRVISRNTVGKTENISCPFDDPINGTISISSTLSEIPRDAGIVIDISSLIKPYFFRLLKHLVYHEKFTNISIVYTEPQSYVKRGFDKIQVEEGTTEVGEIPGFGYHEDQKKGKQLLVMTLGFEGERASDIHRVVDPSNTIAINGFPSYVIDYKDQSILYNSSFLVNAKCFRTLRHASASDPFETYTILEEIYNLWNPTYNITVAPLGTKPMALGVALFAILHADVRVIFSFPTIYATSQVSEKYGKSWIYKIKIPSK